MNVILLGAPGAGKGTQAAALRARLDVPHVSTGDLFRENVGKGTELGLLAKSYMDKGDLVPDDVTIRMVADRLGQPDCARGVLLDGFPRTVDQARALDGILSDLTRKLDRVLYLNVRDEELIKRLSARWICRSCHTPYNTLSKPAKVPGICDLDGGALYQRSDDTAEAAENRIRVFHTETAPLIDFYQARGLLSEVDGQQPPEPVLADMLKALNL